ncbi:hypothetical protein ACH436_20475 [Isoptericola sp. NPDC019693]|uniref:hypothetical protein n=1 Tax=Isoptericola sp. NPDC019693 TaxID=3364009 RepID=UPI00379CF73A
MYDVADLYKAELAIPAAFDAAAADPSDVGGHVRRDMRDRMYRARLLERCVKDVRQLLVGDEAGEDEWADVVSLWDGRCGSVAGGVGYGDRAAPF